MLKNLENPKMTVVMSVRDCDPWVANSIKSILSQTESDFEFLIVDDASTDASSQILRVFQAQDNRIKVFTNDSPIGLAASLNVLIKMARGDYIVRMDADDISHPRRLKEQLSFMEKNKCIGICFSQVNIILDDDEFLCVKWTPGSVTTALFLLPYINYFVHPTAFVRREVYLKKGLYNPNFLKAQDWELWQRLTKKGVRFGIIPDVLFDHRLRLKSSSASLSSSSRYGIAYFKAIVLIRNRYKLRSLYLINKIPRKMLFRYLVNLLLPQLFFNLAVIVHSKFNTNSATQILRRQDNRN